MKEYAISVENISKTYYLYESNKRRILEGIVPLMKSTCKEFKALDNVSFKIGKGEIVGIIGKNGSGKSTILKIITGVLNPTCGKVEINGRISALLELGSGFNPEYTGIENIYLNGTLNGIPRAEMEKRVDAIADFADIGDFIHQPVKNYSSGMFVRLAFAVAINVDPDILIVDEALSVGDAAFQAKCMARMNQIMKQGTTILFVTHDMNTIKRICQRCIYLEKGVMKMDGESEVLADIYLKDIRENMNKEHIKIADDIESTNEILAADSNIAFSERSFKLPAVQDMKKFEDKVNLFREGTKEVEIIYFELTDKERNKRKFFEFNEEIKLRAFIKFHKQIKVGVGFHIRDDKNLELTGSGTVRELGNLITGNVGETIVIEFDTKVPLMEGAYNITMLVSQPVILNRTALFVDYIENIEVFEVGECKKAKLWDKVYLDTDVNIFKLDK